MYVMDRTLTLRTITDADMEFLYCVYASTRADELAQTNWDEAQKAAFLQQQFEAQHQHYMRHYASASFDVIELNGDAVGRLYVARWPREIRIVDIALLPPYRGQRIGEALLKEILTQSQQRGVPVTIHVERFNPALRLYERLGFRVAEDKGVYLFLQWSPVMEVTMVGASRRHASTKATDLNAG